MFENLKRCPVLTAEMVTDGHPDKFCDQVADAILDCALKGDPKSRVAIECLAKDNLIVISGELSTKANLNIEEIGRGVWQKIGYGDPQALMVINFIKEQSADIAKGKENGGVDFGGAGDQGVMLGYATDETPEMMPLEYLYARKICQRLKLLRESGELSWLKADGKSQVTIQNGAVANIVIAAQHVPEIDIEQVRLELNRHVLEPLFGKVPNVVVNGTGAFTVGGTFADAGVVGRKIVVDAYGPRVPVGGGAFSGKDPTKLDRSGAYMARLIAKTIVAHKIGDARECLVSLAYAIGQRKPLMVTAITDKGRDVSSFVKKYFPDLSPESITEYLGLCQPKGWSYLDTAEFGHFGRAGFPWEQISPKR
jgi:S-adenosylmethionine synthetase